MADSSGAVVAGAALTLTDLAQGTVYHAVSDRSGLYSFPNLPVGRYTLTVNAPGFAERELLAIAVDAEAAVRVDAGLTLASASAVVDVTTEAGVEVDTTSTALGETVTAAQMAGLPINGRSYTDLLSIQPGVAPVSTLLPSSVIMAGVTGNLSPSGDENPGNQSINGQRESANGFLVNGIDVQEPMNGGTAVIPDLDAIEQFRVLTNNFDPEYGNYNGGIVTLVTRSGSSRMHGSAFEFFRNTALDARGYFDPVRPEFRRNQFGGTLGGPLRVPATHAGFFFFADYQGTRSVEGISTGNISVPTTAERGGAFGDELTGTVSGPYLAQLLTSRLGYAVASGEPYSTVFPGGVIPGSAVSTPAKNLLQYIPLPNVSSSQFSTAAYTENNRDDKGSIRLDATTRLGRLSGFYFLDGYRLDNPYPAQQGGATVPGFDAITSGQAQLVSLTDTKAIGTRSVNEASVGYLRYSNVIGNPHGGLGVSLESQGFTTGAGTPGIVALAPQFVGVENVVFPTFTFGVPITNELQVNNTLYAADSFSRVLGAHLLKVGVQFHADEVNEHPNGTFNGTFNIAGTETGSPFADFLLGVPSNYTQSSGQQFYLRNHYLGAYAQDTWRLTHDLTLDLGLRWDIIEPWSEKYNQLQTYVAGQQSVAFPNAPLGLLVAGDPGIPSTLAPTSFRNVAPRVGLAYAPHAASGLLRAVFGSGGQSSIRASYGLFYTAFPGLSAGIMYGVPPFGYNYLSPAPPLLATPFITAATGVDNGQRFPFPFAPHGVSPEHPDPEFSFSNFLPIAGDPFFGVHNRVPSLGDAVLSFQRELLHDAVLTVSYVGNQGHHQLALRSVNPGDPALCLRLAAQGCGPFGEDSAYTGATGQIIQGTRVGQGPNFGENTEDASVSNSNYNALETTLKYRGHGSSLLLSYTYSKSIDQGSNLGEQLDPLDPRHTRTISAYDLKHSFVATYTLPLPVAAAFHRTNRATESWTLSGITRFLSGLPVTLFSNSDNSLLGTLGNGANNYLLDTPAYTPGPLEINTDGRNGRPAFNTSLFHEETMGELGNAKRRIFYGPGMANYDLTLEKGVPLHELQLLTLRLEVFNAFNHAQFFGPASVDGQIEDPNFGSIVSAASPRLLELAARFSF